MRPTFKYSEGCISISPDLSLRAYGKTLPLIKSISSIKHDFTISWTHQNFPIMAHERIGFIPLHVDRDFSSVARRTQLCTAFLPSLEMLFIVTLIKVLLYALRCTYSFSKTNFKTALNAFPGQHPQVLPMANALRWLKGKLLLGIGLNPGLLSSSL